ncbi:MAG: hypothetical protein ACKVT2_22440 [Saprospiraceae bacterium]
MNVFSALIQEISRGLSPDLPKDLGDMNQHIDFILPKVIPYGEDLRETQFWLDKRWKEVREAEGFHEALLHIFGKDGVYMLSLDGNLENGTWQQLGEENALILQIGVRKELFDLRFLNKEFMVLTKHGDQARKGLPRFVMLAHEPITKNRAGVELDWRNIMEKFFNVWRENSLSIWAWIFFLGILAGIIYYSFRP